MKHEMVVGTSEAQDFQLLDNRVALNGTGLSIGIEFAVAPGGAPTIAWLNQATGTVRVSNVAGMVVGTYPFRFTLTDGGGKKGYVPNSKAPDVWIVAALGG